MKPLKIATSTLLTSLCLGLPALAQTNAPQTTVQVTEDQIINACVQGRPETLPIPFRDLSPNDWAFKAVMNLYYCGAIGPNTPPAAIETIRNNQRNRLQTTTPNNQNNTF
ncbi:S-layer protein [Phormidium sp. LEGE 05292]|uniref:S-layer protein n=1 Tax=[Phormidium] sp. LEGE 05292 TaxID=767427 RepID=UPI001882112C|nr:S-layer protein [Phormidium sp. LEGE 05292]MBE9227494.1 S-layer protein [Phormidium sp. LEGE 05292]